MLKNGGSSAKPALALFCFQALTGGLPVFLLACFAIICDNSSPFKRTTRLAFVEGTLIFALAIGNAIGTTISENHGFVPVYIFSAVIGLLALLYSAFVFKEQDIDGETKDQPLSKVHVNFFLAQHFSIEFSQPHIKSHKLQRHDFTQIYPQLASGCFNPNNVWTTMKIGTRNELIWIPYVLYFVLDWIGRGEVSVDMAFARDAFGFDGDLVQFDTFWTTFYTIFVVWSFMALMVMVPVLSQVSILAINWTT